MNHTWLPDLTRPRNEIVVLLNWAAATIAALIPALTDADLGTPEGIIIFVFLAAGIIGRRNAYGAETVAELGTSV